MATLKECLRQLIAQGDTEECLNVFTKWAEKNDIKIFSTLILLNGQFSSLERDKNIGVLTTSDYSTGIAKLNYGLIEMIKKLPDNIPAPASSGNNQPNNSPPPPQEQTGNNIILFLAANPSDAPQLNLNQEFVQIYSNVQNSTLNVRTEPATTASLLQTALLNYKPRFVHFSGHGTAAGGSNQTSDDDTNRAIGKIPQTSVNTSGIYLLDPKGAKKFVSGVALANLFGICLRKFQIELVILNACYSEEQAQAIFNAGIPYVIGMNTAIPDATAIEFSTGFYRSLASYNDIAFAFDLAKNAIDLEGLPGEAIPVLYKK